MECMIVLLLFFEVMASETKRKWNRDESGYVTFLDKKTKNNEVEHLLIVCPKRTTAV